MITGNSSKGVTVGTFDGVHRGHRRVVETLRERSAALGLQPMLITFDRHPLEVIAPERAPLRIMPPEEEVAMLRTLDIGVATVAFDDALRHLTAADWIRHLHRDYGTRLLVMGYDNTFGSDGRNLSHEQYQALGATEGVEVVFAPEIPGISSSAVRRAIGQGQLESARKMIGRPFGFSGTVVGGDGLGRTLGFPTANVAPAARQLLPPDGVYAAEAYLPDGEKHRAVVNIGCRPSVKAAGDRRIEAFIPGWQGNLYGERLRLEPFVKLRDEQRFPSLDALKEQIARDADKCLELVPPNCTAEQYTDHKP